jgi:acyl carrier protein
VTVTSSEGAVDERRGPTPGRADEDPATSVLEVVRDLLADARPLGTPPTVRLDARLDTDLGLDSLAIAELLVRLEHRFGRALPEELLARVSTPRDLLEAITDAGSPTSAGAAPDPASWRDRTAGGRGAPEDVATLLAALAWHVEAHPDRPHLRVLGTDGRAEELTYAELWREAGRVAAGLRARGVPVGGTVALMLPTGRSYFTSFVGILLAGAIPAPIYPPGRPSALEEHLRRHARVLDNAQASALVTVAEARPLARLLTPTVPTLRHVVTPDELVGDATAVRPPDLAPGDTALLQYTSGSTGDPKGVVLSHANLLANIHAMRHAGGLTVDDVFVSWLPLYHDMGLIGSWLLSLTAGLPFVVMSPLAFLARPSRWLWAMHEHGGTVSGGPNFGYELCLRRVADDELEGLDLSTWRLAFNGAEPVSPATVTGFAARFSAHGFAPGAMTPVYGLAEASVALTVPPIGRGAVIDRVAREPLRREGRAAPAPADDDQAVRFVACGPPLRGHEVRIVDRQGNPLGERQEGVVQFRGPSATSGYHRNERATRQLFVDGWLDTGDLGYLADGELHLTGRRKDLIIRAGRNLHPSELEEAVGAVDGVRRGCVAVVAAADPASGTERLVVIAETRETDEAQLAELRREAGAAVLEVAGTPPDEVRLVGPGAVPKTSSGKIRRAEARGRYERGELDRVQRPVWWQVARLAGTSLLPRLRGAGPRVVAVAYGVYARVVFVALSAIVLPLVVVLPGPRRRWEVVRLAGRALFALAGVPVRVRGAANLRGVGPAVVTANHASFLDPLLLARLFREPPVFVAVAGLAEQPVVRLFLRRLGAHLVDRGDRARADVSRRELIATVREGRTVVFFPEGRRAPAPGLEPFRSGAFLVAADAAVPVVPVALRGTRALLPVGRRLPAWSRITITVEPPVRTEQVGWTGAAQLHAAAREAILQHCGEPDLA